MPTMSVSKIDRAQKNVPAAPSSSTTTALPRLSSSSKRLLYPERVTLRTPPGYELSSYEDFGRRGLAPIARGAVRCDGRLDRTFAGDGT